MCLYPKLIRNKKYTINKKNGGKVPTINDERTTMVPIGCGNCKECRTMKKREWQVRLQEEIRTENNGKFVTMTFTDESISKLCKKVGTTEGNAIAIWAVRKFLERWRKKYKKSVRHWLITELGHKGTERIHLHGIIWTDHKEDIERIWQYGNVWIGEYVNEITINYIVKYVTKIDIDHKGYKAKILTSPGIGSNYMNRSDVERNIYNGEETKETYKARNGSEIGLPIYYRNKIYSEQEREELWINKLNKEIRWIQGRKYKVDTEQGQEEYNRALKAAQKRNERIGYGTDGDEWKENKYNASLNMLKKMKEQKEYAQNKYNMIHLHNKLKKQKGGKNEQNQ